MLGKKRASSLRENVHSNQEIITNFTSNQFSMNNTCSCNQQSNKLIKYISSDTMLKPIEVQNSQKDQPITLSIKYPFYNTIKKIMYAFGDCYDTNHDSVLQMDDFINHFLIELNEIVLKCDYKKIINHFFSYEYEKFYDYTKLKMKNSFITNQSYQINRVGIKNKICYDEVTFDNDANEIFISDDETYLNESNRNTNNHRQTFDLEEKDDNYTENISFQNERTERMSTEQYLEYCVCRQCNFLSLGKKYFKDYLQSLLYSKCADELKNDSNIELIAFILKEEIKNIITEAIKSKHPKQKLSILTHPLLKEDIKPFCQEEQNKLTVFLNDFNSDILLSKAFKKKQILNRRAGNKNVKIKTTDQGLVIIIKKYILIENINEAEQFKIMKLNAEVQALNSFLLLRDKYIVLIQNIKNKVINSIIVPDYTKLNFTGMNKTNITVKDLIAYLGIDNYYEYFLVKDYLFEIDLKEIKTTEIEKMAQVLSKIRLKTLANKFDTWLKMSNEEQHNIIDIFDSLKDKLSSKSE